MGNNALAIIQDVIAWLDLLQSMIAVFLSVSPLNHGPQIDTGKLSVWIFSTVTSARESELIIKSLSRAESESSPDRVIGLSIEATKPITILRAVPELPQ